MTSLVRPDGLVQSSGDLPAHVIISRFTSHKSGAARRETLTPAMFRRLLTEHEIGTKEGAAWSPAVFKTDWRKSSNAESVGHAVLDLDKDAPTVASAAERLRARGIAGIIHTTWGHEVDAPRLRVVVNPSEPWRAADYGDPGAGDLAFKAGLTNLAAQLGFTADSNAIDPARLYFLPRHKRDAPCEALWIDGKPANVWPGPHPSRDSLPMIEDEDEDETDWLDGLFNVPPDTLRSAIAGTPNDIRFHGRDKWFSFLCAIKNTLGDAGRNDAEAWSERWEGGEHDRSEFDRAWNSIKSVYRGRKAGVGTIIAHAKESGWIDPRQTDDHLSAARALADERAAGGDV